MKKKTVKKPLSPRAREELKTQISRVRPFASAELMWEQMFTDADRKKQGGDLEAAWKKLGTAGMWAKVRRTSPERAVLDVALGIGHMDQAKYEWLLREMGMRRSSPKPKRTGKPPVPEWNKHNGELHFRGQLIRKIRVMANPSNIQRIVDAFQEEGWPTSIDNPLPGGEDQHRLHLTLQSLNRGLKRIRFRGHKGGSAIYWEEH